MKVGCTASVNNDLKRLIDIWSKKQKRKLTSVKLDDILIDVAKTTEILKWNDYSSSKK